MLGSRAMQRMRVLRLPPGQSTEGCMAMAGIEPYSIPEGLAFDDVLLRPGLSAVMPNATNIGTQLTRAIRLNLPIISAAMDTVTEARLAIAMAGGGGTRGLPPNLAPTH